MKKFTINCQFGGQTSPFTVYIGKPDGKHHPLHFQADWLSKERGGSIPAEVMNSLSKLMDLSQKNNVPFEELCAYALEAAQAPSQMQVESHNNAVDDYYSQSQNTQSDEQPPQQNNPQNNMQTNPESAPQAPVTSNNPNSTNE